MIESDLHKSIKELLLEQGVSRDFSLELLKGGRNNRVYKLTSGLEILLLKKYFCHPGDLRDRCTTEFAFSTFTWQQGIRTIPKPLACNAESGIALYEYKEGQKLFPSDVNESFVQKATQFLSTLNTKEARTHTRLPIASEACFSIADHIKCVAARVERLNCSLETSMYDTVKKLIKLQLVPTWLSVQQQAAETSAALQLSPTRELSKGEQIISPSDFGFHNALLMVDGTLSFFDFEYAGWDDPAKTVCDFFLQPDVPVSIDYLPVFIDGIFLEYLDKEQLALRVKALFPVYQIKWCCILLNEFVPVGSSRRTFSQGIENIDRMYNVQFHKAINIIEQIKEACFRS